MSDIKEFAKQNRAKAERGVRHAISEAEVAGDGGRREQTSAKAEPKPIAQNGMSIEYKDVDFTEGRVFRVRGILPGQYHLIRDTQTYREFLKVLSKIQAETEMDDADQVVMNRYEIIVACCGIVALNEERKRYTDALPEDCKAGEHSVYELSSDEIRVIANAIFELNNPASEVAEVEQFQQNGGDESGESGDVRDSSDLQSVQPDAG